MNEDLVKYVISPLHRAKNPEIVSLNLTRNNKKVIPLCGKILLMIKLIEHLND